MSDQTVVAEFTRWEQSLPDRAAHPCNPFPVIGYAELEQSVPQRFAKMVAQHANRLAVKDANHIFTFDELNRMANRVAWAILSRADSPPTVALLMDHSALPIVALMGVIKAGKAYVPFDALYPPARLAYMLQDSQTSLILTDKSNRAMAHKLAAERMAEEESGPIEVLVLEELDDGLSTDDPQIALSPDLLAYIQYTSGTTGQPKGIMGTHRQVLHFSMVYANSSHIGPGDRVSLVASLSYNDSLSHIFPALLNGASVLPFEVRTEGPARLTDWLIRERITFHGCVPSLLRQTCASLKEGETFSDIRVIKIGGDRVDVRDLELYKAHFGPDCVMRIGYGTSECKFIAQYFLNKDSQVDGVMPVGYAVPDVEIMLLDEDGQPVELGRVGEIVVRSRYIVPGYWRRPKETCEKFLPDPEGGDKRVYHTGDLGRMEADGRLTHVGRKDFQVKVRGYRVEIEEIEAALLALAQVDEAVVDLAMGPTGEAQLVAYVVPVFGPDGSRSTVTTSGLRRALEGRLPDFMIPLKYVALEEMPFTAHGKIDRRALPKPESGRPDLDSVYAGPRNEFERALVRIWEDLLGIRPIGIRDNFYDLGGHSLLLARLLVRIEEELSEEGLDRAALRSIPLRDFFRLPTVEQLASMLEALSGDGSRRPVKRSGRVGRGSRLVALWNRLLQLVALYVPGANSVRVWLHRQRGVSIGKDVFIGMGTIIESEFPWLVSIGDHVTISVRAVFIGHFRGTAQRAKLDREPSVRVENNVYIGPGVIILPNVTIGEGAVVSAGSIVKQSVQPMTVVEGNPAKVIAKCGVPLKGSTYADFVHYLEPVD